MYGKTTKQSRVAIALLLATAVSLWSRCAVAESEPDQASDEDCCQQELLLHVPSPAWEDQIIYFLMTDRFDDGDSANNDLGAGEFDTAKELSYSGGDIQGIIDRLDYIEGLGATAVWPTPLVLNQWKSQRTGFTGFSGYYAVDFSMVDPHNGDLATYRLLSDKLHRRGMYLIKDIVVNHTGFFFGYDGEYDPNDTSKNFVLLEDESSSQQSPTYPPFHKIDRNLPDHYEAGIYNWTPPILDYQNLGERQYTYQLGGLADINTKNPVVIDALKGVYGDWIEKVGVDAFRIDTVRYVEPEFFSRFLHDADGILNRALETGRTDFLAFGEVLDYSKPFENSGERAIAAYLGNDDDPILPAAVSFPLKQEIKTVLGQGKPTAQLAYRLNQHMETYRNPYLTPTFVDNHDVPRFLASGTEGGFRQAFALIFTIPGIPTIYQGSAQMHLESRQAMFEGGYLSDRDHFDVEADMYRFIASLARLRKSNSALRRGTFEILASNSKASGLLAFRRSNDDQTLDVIFNTADQDVVVDNLSLPGTGDGAANVLYSNNFDGEMRVRNHSLTTILPARSIIVLDHSTSGSAGQQHEGHAAAPTLGVSDNTSRVFTDDVLLRGTAAVGSNEIWLVKNGNVRSSVKIQPDQHGRWEYLYPVEDLGEHDFYLIAYDPANSSASPQLQLRTLVKKPTLTATRRDPVGDDTGPTGDYVDMQQPNATEQKDIVRADAASGGQILELHLTMKDLTTDWLPPNGFDNVAFSIFFDLPGASEVSALPELNASMPGSMDWELGHVFYGWGNTMFSNDLASAERAGKRFSSAPGIMVDQSTKTITLSYDGSELGVTDWAGVKIYITTWDISGEGAYVRLAEEPADWSIGGAGPGDPKILDDILLALPDSDR